MLVWMIASALCIGAAQARYDDRVPSKGFAVDSGEGRFHPYEFTRHAVGDNHVPIETLYTGICHSDLHAARDKYRVHGITGIYPMVPGHEIAGRAGKNVIKFKIGDYAGVDCRINSCGHCTYCDMDKQPFCEKRTPFPATVSTAIPTTSRRWADIPIIG